MKKQNISNNHEKAEMTAFAIVKYHLIRGLNLVGRNKNRLISICTIIRKHF